jgi:hypothetical protein
MAVQVIPYEAGCVPPGPYAIADVSGAEPLPLAFIHGAKRSPFVLVEVPAKGKPGRKPGKAKLRRVDVPVVIIAKDGTWHRPMTPLELARLQDLPAFVDGKPAQMLLTLLAADVGAGLAPSGGLVWVDPHAMPHAEAGGPAA